MLRTNPSPSFLFFPTLRRLGPCLLLAFGLAACNGGGSDSNSAGADGGGGGGGGGGGKLANGQGPCESADECAGDVCVAIIDANHPPVYCTQSCGDCAEGFYCDEDSFALVGLAFCRFGETPNTPPPPPEEPPRLPCKSDSECQQGLVCATFMGESDCTISCIGESDCSLDLGGLSIDLHQCAADQRGDVDRQVCLPDPSCFPDATACIGVPGF